MIVQRDQERDTRPSSIINSKEEETVQARLKFTPEDLKQSFLRELGSARVVHINITHFEGGHIAGIVANP